MHQQLHTNIVRYMAVALLLATIIACGAATTPTPVATQAPSGLSATSTTPTSPAEPASTPTSDVVSSLQDVRRATIQIEAQGSFVDSQLGARLNVIGRGSGVIIDESGIAVTNNHVVTGAAILQVWVEGEAVNVNSEYDFPNIA